MASIQGKEGKIADGANSASRLKNWQLDIARDQLDNSELGTEWKEFLNGIAEWSGSFDGNFDAGDTNGQLVFMNALLNGTVRTDLTLYTDLANTKGFFGAANISSLGVGVAYDQIETGSFSFQGTGELTYSEAIS